MFVNIYSFLVNLDIVVTVKLSCQVYGYFIYFYICVKNHFVIIHNCKLFLNPKIYFCLSGGNSIDVITAFEQQFPGAHFGMYGLLKDKVFTEKPQSLEHLKELIEDHFNFLFTLQLYKKRAKC